MRFFFWLLLLVVSLAASLFAVSNRQSIELGFWPFPLVIGAPVFLIVLSILGAGLGVGWVLGWLAASPVRRERRRLARTLAACEAELADLRAGRAKDVGSAIVPRTAPGTTPGTTVRPLSSAA